MFSSNYLFNTSDFIQNSFDLIDFLNKMSCWLIDFLNNKLVTIT